ncbi:hypothetical protein CR513_00041, partial [Mucuna pruriens]
MTYKQRMVDASKHSYKTIRVYIKLSKENDWLFLFEDGDRISRVHRVMDDVVVQRFGVPKTLICDQGSNRAMPFLLDKYEVVHRIATKYHAQTNG